MISPHAPQHNRRLRRLLGPLHYTDVFWYRFSNWGARVTPRWAVGIFVNFFAVVFFLTLGGIRRAIAENLETALGSAGRGPGGWLRRQVRAFRTFHNLSWCHGERYEQHAGNRSVEVVTEGEEAFQELLAGEQGFLLITAHIGHWEVGSILASSLRRRHVHVVREQEGDPKAQEYFQRLMRSREEGFLTVHFPRNNPRLGIELLSALRRGDIVAIQGDRPSGWGKSATVELFGRPLALPVGPVKLARAAGVPLQPIFVFREGRLRARLVFRPPFRVDPEGDADTAAQQALARVAREVEWAIRQRPHQWFCYRSLWGDDPAPADGAAEPAP